MIHAHMAFWVIGAPRIDKIEVLPDGVTATPHSESANRLAAFWDRGFTEFNVAKAMAGKRSTWAELSALASARS